MIQLDFSIKRKKVSTKPTFLLKNVQAVVHFKTITGESGVTMCAKVNNSVYDFSTKSLDCKHHQKVYLKELDKNGKRITYIRLPFNACSLDTKLFSPFYIGCIINGDVINENGKIVFNFKSIVEGVNEDAINALKEYKKYVFL